MSNNLQLTLPGSLSQKKLKRPSDKIDIDLDDQTGEYGHAIGWKLFEEIVTEFHNKCLLRPTEKTSYVIDKQILHILMSSTNCTSLLLSKCLRNDGVESIAFTALGADGVPLGIKIDPNTKKSTLSNDSSQSFSGEWIQGLTLEDERNAGVMPPDHEIQGGFNFDLYIKEIQSKGFQLAQAFL